MKMSFDKNQTTGRPRLAALQQGAGALGLAVLSAGALAGNPGACAAIADNTERLACYDESVGRPHQEAPPRPPPCRWPGSPRRSRSAGSSTPRTSAAPS
jgi:hypothetical protein